MRHWTNLSIIISCIFSVLAVSAQTGINMPVKSFQEWKNEKIQNVSTQTNNLRMQIMKAQSDRNTKQQEFLERQLQQLKWNSEVARDLSVTDYFTLYLSQQPQSDRFQQAAQKMNPIEVAELMESYSNILGLKKPETQLIQSYQVTSGKVGPKAIQAAQQK